MKNIALILASGSGERCGLGFPKQFAVINNKTILEHTIDAFERHKNIDEIILVTSKECIDKVNAISHKYKKISKVILGGRTRKDSSYNGIFSINDDEANVLIHDAVRPLITEAIITNCISALETKKAICTTIDSTDTIYLTDENGKITDIPKRRLVKRAQTPQCFKLSLIRKAHELAKSDVNCVVTDDCGLIMYYKLADIYTITGDINNIKVTYSNDIEFVKNIINN